MDESLWEDFERVPAVVLGCLLRGELRIVVLPGLGGGAHFNVPLELIPFDLRMPNTPLWIKFDHQFNINKVVRRDQPDWTSEP
jgi:hypothetical protein